LLCDVTVPLIPSHLLLLLFTLCCAASPQYTEEADPELEPMVTRALKFLLNRGREKEKEKDKDKEKEKEKEKECKSSSSSSSSSSTSSSSAVSSTADR
jgi:hypothetical protein